MDIIDYWCNLDLNDLPGEEWRSVGIVAGVDFSGYYVGSNFGRIKSLDRFVSNGKKMILVHSKIVKQNINKRGYCFAHLSKNGKSLTVNVHNIIAGIFVFNDDIEHKTQVNHKNEIKTDNRPENLEWCTQQYNLIYGTKVERTLKTKKGLMSGCKKIVQLTLSGKFIRSWNSITEAGNSGYNCSCISNCCRKRVKHHGGYKWMYFEEYKEEHKEVER